MVWAWCVKDKGRRPVWLQRMSEGKVGDAVGQVGVGVGTDTVESSGGPSILSLLDQGKGLGFC